MSVRLSKARLARLLFGGRPRETHRKGPHAAANRSSQHKNEPRLERTCPSTCYFFSHGSIVPTNDHSLVRQTRRLYCLLEHVAEEDGNARSALRRATRAGQPPYGLDASRRVACSPTDAVVMLRVALTHCPEAVPDIRAALNSTQPKP